MPSYPLDETALKQLFDDVGPAAGELVGHFITDVRSKIDAFSGLTEAMDVCPLAIHAHSLKGLCRTCGMNDLSDTAYDLEKACRAGNNEQAASHFAIIADHIEPAIKALLSFTEENS